MRKWTWLKILKASSLDMDELRYLLLSLNKDAFNEWNEHFDEIVHEIRREKNRNSNKVVNSGGNLTLDIWIRGLNK